MLHLYVRGPLDRLKDAALDLAEETGVWLAAGFRATDDPGVQVTELSFGEASLAVPPDESAALYERLLERAAAPA
jgi:hypothetical protein